LSPFQFSINPKILSFRVTNWQFIIKTILLDVTMTIVLNYYNIII